MVAFRKSGMKKFTIDQLNEFRKAKNATKPCEACGEDNWMLFENPAGDLGIPIWNSSGELNAFPSHMPVITIVCDNCGNVRFHARYYVEEFFEEPHNAEGA
jgi:hypothetical protein